MSGTQGSNVVPDFTALRVAVVGDLIADRYVYARPTRISREAPVIVLRYVREEIKSGGAANVARNLWALGARTTLIGAVGRDAEGRELLRQLEQDLVDVGRVATVAPWRTPTKTRIVGAEPGRTMHQVLRIDREPEVPLARDTSARIADEVRGLAGRVDALLVSDYDYGLVNDEVAAAAREVQAAGAVVVLDPRRTVDPFRGVTALTPNLGELCRISGIELDEPYSAEDLRAAAAVVLERVQPEWLLVTLGNRGMSIFSRELCEGLRIPASGPDEVVDVSGAGDTAAAAFTLALSAGLEGPAAMRLANAAAGVVVLESGTAVCSLSKLRSALPLAPRVQAPLPPPAVPGASAPAQEPATRSTSPAAEAPLAITAVPSLERKGER